MPASWSRRTKFRPAGALLIVVDALALAESPGFGRLTGGVTARRRKRAIIDVDRYVEGREVLVTSPVERVPNRQLVHDAAALTAALSGYDALYAALARRLGCQLLTADARFAATAAEQLGLVVVHVPR